MKRLRNWRAPLELIQWEEEPYGTKLVGGLIAGLGALGVMFSMVTYGFGLFLAFFREVKPGWPVLVVFGCAVGLGAIGSVLLALPKTKWNFVAVILALAASSFLIREIVPMIGLLYKIFFRPWLL